MPTLSTSQFAEVRVLQLKAILTPLGWTITAEDRRGEQITLTIQMDAQTLAAEFQKFTSISSKL